MVSQYNPQFELFNQLISGELIITGQFQPAYFQTMTRTIKLSWIKLCQVCGGIHILWSEFSEKIILAQDTYVQL